MKIFHRYDKCFGITLFRFRQLNIEIWFCPKNYKIIEHTHPHEDIELMFLYGKAKFYRRDLETENVEVKCVQSPKDSGIIFTVKSKHSHWFQALAGNRLVFLNISNWHKGHKPTSAADDFKLTPKQELVYKL